MLTWISSVEAIANRRKISMAQVALAWCMSKDPVSAPVVGTTSVKNLEDLVGKFSVSTSDRK